jgi:hypothetical protein
MQLVGQTGKKTTFEVTETKQSYLFQLSDLHRNSHQNKKVNEVTEEIVWKDISGCGSPRTFV